MAMIARMKWEQKIVHYKPVQKNTNEHLEETLKYPMTYF